MSREGRCSQRDEKPQASWGKKAILGVEGGRQEWQGLGEDATGASTHRTEAAWTTRCWERQDDPVRSGIQFGLIGFTEESDMRCDRKERDQAAPYFSVVCVLRSEPQDE